MIISFLRSRLGKADGLGRRLVGEGIGSGAVKLLSTLTTMGLTVTLARVLGVEGYGVYTYVLALVTLLAIPAQAGLPFLVLRETAAAQATQTWGRMRGLWLWSNRAVGLISLTIAVGAGGAAWIFGGHFTDTQTSTFVWGLLLIPLFALGNLRGASLRGLQKVVVGLLPEFIIRPGTLAITVLVLALFQQQERLLPQHIMASHVLAASVAFGVGLYLLYRNLPEPMRANPEPTFDARGWLGSLVPLSILVTANVVHQQAGILILGIFGTADDVGTFRVAVQTANLVGLGLATLNLAVAPHFARLCATGDTFRVQRLATATSRIALLAALPATVVLVLWGDLILSLAFGPEYVEANRVLSILAVGHLMNAAMGPVALVLNMSGHEADSMRSRVVAVFVNVGLNVALIPKFGLEGAGIAAVLSLTLWNLLMYKSVRDRLGIDGTALGRPARR